jgi:hypothetical protein
MSAIGKRERQEWVYSVDKHGLHAVVGLFDQAIAVRWQIDRTVCSGFQPFNSG